MKPVVNNTAVALHSGSRIKELDSKSITNFLIDQISIVYVKTGKNIPESRELNITIQQFKKYLERDWPGVKLEWIEKAFERGVEKQYGEYYGVSYVTFTDWMKGYRNSMKAEDFGVKEDPMPSKERASFVLNGLKNMPNTSKLISKHKSNR